VPHSRYFYAMRKVAAGQARRRRSGARHSVYSA
jgi:hypothetical protein